MTALLSLRHQQAQHPSFTVGYTFRTNNHSISYTLLGPRPHAKTFKVVSGGTMRLHPGVPPPNTKNCSQRSCASKYDAHTYWLCAIKSADPVSNGLSTRHVVLGDPTTAHYICHYLSTNADKSSTWCVGNAEIHSAAVGARIVGSGWHMKDHREYVLAHRSMALLTFLYCPRLVTISPSRRYLPYLLLHGHHIA